MTFSVSARTTGWVAIGVSNDGRMVSYAADYTNHISILHFCRMQHTHTHSNRQTQMSLLVQLMARDSLLMTGLLVTSS